MLKKTSQMTLQISQSLASRNWTWFLVPMNASASGISTAIPIYMLSLGGQVREVALAAFLSNLAVTLGAIFWGRLIDRMHWRMMIIAISSAAMAVTAALMYFVSDMLLLMLLSALVGFFSVGPAPVTSLLVMEKSRKEDWLKVYSWTSLVSSVGLVVAMAAGYFWLMQYDARSYAIACSAIAILSLALAIAFVKDPKSKLDRKLLAKSPALFYRLRQVPMIFLAKAAAPAAVAEATGAENASEKKGRKGPDFSKLVAAGVSRKEFIFFAGVGLFYLSGNLLFTPYTPFLKDSGISDSQVFLAYTVLHMSKVVFLPFNHSIVARGGEERLGKLAYVPRASGIALAAAAAFLVASNPASILAITLLAFVGAEIGFSIWSTTTTSSLLKIIPCGKEGKVLGVNSSVTGAGLLLGSLAAGEAAASLGYGTTFILAIVLLLASFAMISRFFVKVKAAAQAAAANDDRNNNATPALVATATAPPPPQQQQQQPQQK